VTSGGVTMDVLLLRDRIAEAGNRYAASLNVDPTDDWIIMKTLEEAGELVQSFLRYSARARTRGLTAEELKRALDDEIADLLGFSLVLAKRFDVDLLRALERKWHLPEGSLR
jgi:NTP pyrophosphatase (non-canonical NTP hydrolase)